jgi:hypothetical protein
MQVNQFHDVIIGVNVIFKKMVLVLGKEKDSLFGGGSTLVAAISNPSSKFFVKICTLKTSTLLCCFIHNASLLFLWKWNPI